MEQIFVTIIMTTGDPKYEPLTVRLLIAWYWGASMAELVALPLAKPKV
jgi:hypothetical protein